MLTKKINEIKSDALKNKAPSFRKKEFFNLTDKTNDGITAPIQTQKNLDPEENDTKFLKPTYNLEINRNTNNLFINEDSQKNSSKSYSTAASFNKMFYIPNDDSIVKLYSKENSLELSSNSSNPHSRDILKKSKSFSFEKKF